MNLSTGVSGWIPLCVVQDDQTPVWVALAFHPFMPNASNPLNKTARLKCMAYSLNCPTDFYYQYYLLLLSASIISFKTEFAY